MATYEYDAFYSVLYSFCVQDFYYSYFTGGETAVAEGVNSGAIAASAAQILGGSGGGRRNFGQGGGPKTDKIGDALKVAEETLVRQVKELKQK